MPDVLMLPVLAGVFGCTLDHLYGIPLPEKAEGEVLPAQESAGFPEDDGVYRAVLMRGGQILEIRQIPQELANGERIVLHIDGDVAGNIQSAFSVEVGGSVTVQADGCGRGYSDRSGRGVRSARGRLPDRRRKCRRKCGGGR